MNTTLIRTESARACYSPNLEVRRKRAAVQLRRTSAESRQTTERLDSGQSQLMEFEKAQALARFAATIAHEIRNPLAVLQLGLQVVSESANDAETLSVLADMRGAIHRASAVIANVMEGTADKLLDVRRQDLNGTVTDVLANSWREFDRAQIKVVVDRDPNLSAIAFDEVAIARVLGHVVLNACEAMPDGGMLTVRTERKRLTADEVVYDAGNRSGICFRAGEDVAVVEVSDTGGGIPRERLAEVFDAFVTTKPTGGALGLGLTVARKIMDLHGGSIELRNRDGGGVTATLRFKL